MDSTAGGPEDSHTTGRTSRPRGGLVAAVLVVAGLAAGATGVAMASDGTSSPAASPTASPTATSGDEGRGDGGPRLWRHRDRDGRLGRPGPGPGLFGLRGAVHGEFVVPDPDGGYQTVHSQRGEVTAVSTSSITVRSEDGFSKTYSVTPDTLVNAARDGIDTVEAGDHVSVLAVEETGEVTAIQIIDLSRLGDLRERFGPPERGDGTGGGGATTDTTRTLLRGV